MGPSEGLWDDFLLGFLPATPWIGSVAIESSTKLISICYIDNCIINIYIYIYIPRGSFVVPFFGLGWETTSFWF